LHFRIFTALWAALLVVTGIGATAVRSATPVSLNRDGTLQVAGRNMSCGGVDMVLDARLPNLGAAGPGVLVINPRLLRRETTIVGLFVFQHECGHHHVGSSELGADCWAVNRGVRDGWLDAAGLKQVCRSFGGAPETSTHPSAARRCGNLDKCFATALATMPKRAPPAVSPPPVTTSSWSPATASPKLVAGPTLVRVGFLRGRRG
jgi:hypothetical protein